MADLEGVKVAKNYHLDVPFANQEGFYVKGANALDWGMKKHMSNIFDAKSGNTVMFAFDHGYFMGSTAGLERLDLIIPKLIPNIDVLMGTRGALRSCVDPALIGGKGVALRATSGSSMLNDDLSHEVLAVDAAEACRMNADCSGNPDLRRRRRTAVQSGQPFQSGKSGPAVFNPCDGRCCSRQADGAYRSFL